ncbi:MAG: hypothetical protein IJZ75_05990 [Clostridia bacterium]|nr:hypothetical protein [Clostridia bacterium]
MNKIILNPDKYNGSILKLENDARYLNKKREELLEKRKKAKNNNMRDLLGILMVLTILGFAVFTALYSPLRESFFNLLQVDISSVSFKEVSFWQVVEFIGMWKFIGIYLTLIVMEAIIVSIALRQGFFETIGIMLLAGLFSISVLILPAGIYLLFVDISINNGQKKEVKKELEPLEKRLEKVQNTISTEKEKQANETRLLYESETMFEHGVAENNTQLILEAANIGNPKAIKYLENKEKNERLNQGRKLYQEAKNSSPTDMELMEKAAELGDPNAIFEIAEYYFKQTDTDLLTNSEKRKLEQKADKYLKNGNFKKHPDARILQINRLIETSKEVDYYGLLAEVRKLKREEKISQKYIDMADDIIRVLVRHFDYEEKDIKINAASYNIDNPAEFMKNTQAIIDKQLGINRSSAPDGAFVPRIDVSDM